MEDQVLSYEEFNAPRPPIIPEPLQWLSAPVIFALLTLLMFFDVLFTSKTVISHITTDLALQFLPWRDFGFSEMAKGNLPLWNPYIYGGAPYFAGFQSALLYPPNWLHLILPLGVAINWIVAVHVFMLGYFVYLWARGKGVGISGAIIAGVMFMFSGPYFLHIYAGHLPHLAVIVWVPLMFLALDKLANTGDWKWLLLGIFATSMHILGGHPQYVYYTGMAMAAYTILSIFSAQHRGKLALGFVGMYLGAVLLTAVQLFAGIDAASEGVRNTGLSYEMAGTFSLPPSNLVTLVAPTFFSQLPKTPNGANELPYWGAGYLWELSFFVSVTGLVLAVLGVVELFKFESEIPAPAGAFKIMSWIARNLGRKPQIVVLICMILITFVLALGRHTPLYWAMYNWLPGYNGFRGTVKFSYLTMMFISILAGMGFDALLRDRRVHISAVIAVAAVALALFAYGGFISASGGGGPSGHWGSFVASVVDTAQNAKELFSPALLTAKSNPAFLSATAEQAATALFLGAGTLIVVATLLAIVRLNPLLPYTLMLLVMIEMFTFARMTRATMPMPTASAMPKPWLDIINQIAKPGRNLRVLTIPIQVANAGMSTAAPFENLNGYDPGVLRYFAELISEAQGEPRANASQYLPFRPNPLHDRNLSVFRALRCAVVFPQPNASPFVITNPLPVASLYGTWSRFSTDEELLAYMISGDWKQNEIVLTKEQPNVPMTPTLTPPGTLRILGEGTDYLEVEADLQGTCMMLITNNYSKGWRVVPLSSSSKQEEYWVMRANYTQIGVPLFPGKHHLRIEYSPFAYRLGWWVSLIALLAFVAWAILLMRRPAKLR